MQHIQTFESYLLGGRQLLYHSTYRLDAILETDSLLPSKPADRTDPCVCVTRSLTFRYGSFRFALDAELLRQDGYISTPVCEVGGLIVRMKNKKRNVIKSNIEEFRTGFRGVENNVKGLPNSFKMEYEYEERFYEPIENLGKYVVYIDLLSNQGERYLNINLEKYLERYPHIKMRAEGDRHYKLYHIGYGEVAPQIEIPNLYR